MYYLSCETLVPCSLDALKTATVPYVANISKEVFDANRDVFKIDTDFDIDYSLSNISKAEINSDSLTGCISIPNRENITVRPRQFFFAANEHGIVFIEDDGIAQDLINRLMSKRWKKPSLEHFLHDFLEGIIHDDLSILERYELEMDMMEDNIIAGNIDGVMSRLSDIRSALLDIRTHYVQLSELGEQFEDNEDEIFDTENVYFFRLFIDKVNRLQNVISSLRDHTLQVRDLYQTQIDIRQNRNMTVLTVVATIFMPLTLITGWYGMNFVYMPELNSPWGYPILIIICALIVLISIFYFKKKKWL